MPGIFVTATGTEVGKTYVTAGLLRAARRAGRPARALKPVLSGFSPAEASTSDAGVLLDASGRALTPAELDAISPWRFAAPLSPDMAAAAEGRRIDLADVVTFCQAALATDESVFVEGVGGVMVPLNERETVLDLIAALALPVVLVTATALGAISHCLTAATVLTARGCAPTAVVLNESADSTVALGATQATLRSFLPDATFATIPRGGSEGGADNAFEALFARLLDATDAVGSSRRNGSTA